MDGLYSKKNMKLKDLNGSTLIISIIKLFVIWWICHTKVFWLLWMKPVWTWVKPLIQCFWKPWTENWKEMSIIQVVQLIQKKTKILLSGKILSSGIMQVKFIYSEKTKKFCEIYPLLLTVCTVVRGKISQNFVAFSEYMNFILSFRLMAL